MSPQIIDCSARVCIIAGNSWGVDPETKEGCIGCGPQEQFYGCADVAVCADQCLHPSSSLNATSMASIGYQANAAESLTWNILWLFVIISVKI